MWRAERWLSVLAMNDQNFCSAEREGRGDIVCSSLLSGMLSWFAPGWYRSSRKLITGS